MKEWSDDELDKLFQKSAEELNPPYDPGDWQDLRRRLDEADGVVPAGWLKKNLPWLILGLLLLIGGLGVYYGTGDNEGRRVSSVVTGTRPSDQLQAEANPVSEPGKQSRKSSGTSDQQLLPSRTNALRGTPEGIDSDDLKELPRNLASVSGVRKQPNRSDQERGDGAILLPEITPNAESKIPPHRENRAGVPWIETPQPMQGKNDKMPGEILESQNENPLRENWLHVKLLASRRIYQEEEGPTYPGVAYIPTPDSTSGANSPGPPPADIQLPQWSVRLGISPDLSAVRMSDMMHSMRPGPSTSLLVERSISDKLTLQTGVIRSLKNYSALFSDYHPAKHLYQTVMPVSVDGACTVFEVPLNMRFDFIQGPKARWFVGAGVSSYKMQKEKYIYKYDTYVRGAAKGWGPKGTGWYLLSHANASVGYERRLSRHLSLLAEPYARIPLRGVGYGKVNLFTGGIWFSLRYSPAFRK